MLRCVRTTIRLPDELYTRVRVEAAGSGTTVTSFIEDALRAALARHDSTRTTGAARPYVVRPIGGNGVQAGVDLDDASALADLMDGP